MNTIWRFVVDSQVEMPVGAKIIRTATRDGEVCIWAIVDPEARKTQRSFAIRATGLLFEQAMTGTYLGSVRLDGCELHVFETTFAKGLHEEAIGR